VNLGEWACVIAIGLGVCYGLFKLGGWAVARIELWLRKF
jgi:hypothetical protein